MNSQNNKTFTKEGKTLQGTKRKHKLVLTDESTE